MLKHLLAVILFLAAATAQGAEPLTRKQVKALIHTAKTPDDHLRIAAFYRREAADLLTQAKEQEALADEYDRNPSSHPIPKGVTFGANCRNLARYYRERAKSDTKKAEFQEQLAQSAK